jgi:hypothetical protein
LQAETAFLFHFGKGAAVAAPFFRFSGHVVEKAVKPLVR